jgi:hypothetical protein
MSVIYTPGGLKIRLDPDRVALVLAPAQDQIDLHDAYLDVELWANFPNAFSSTCTIITAFATHSFMWTLTAFLITFAAANAFQTLAYSHILNLIFPTFLGSWIISLPFSIATGVYLYINNALFLGIAQLIIVVVNWLGYTDLLLFLLTPIRVAIRIFTGSLVGDVEIALMRILSLQARRAGIELDWNLYNKQGT